MNAMLYIRTVVFRAKQSEFADIANVAQATISRWENGLGEPSLTDMKTIREAAANRNLDWSDDWFYSAPKEAA